MRIGGAISMLVVGLCVGCTGESDGGEDGSPSSLSCTVCVDLQELELDLESCTDVAYANQGPCVLDGEIRESVHISASGRREEPICPGEPGELASGVESNLGEWDYECQLCGGDESEIDAAHDGGVEDSGCARTVIFRDMGDYCPGEGLATVVALSDCAAVRRCAE